MFLYFEKKNMKKIEYKACLTSDAHSAAYWLGAWLLGVGQAKLQQSMIIRKEYSNNVYD